MALKPKKSHHLSEPSPAKPDPWSGPWGRINPAASGFDVVRFCQRGHASAEMTHSYPYRVISSWHWRDNAAEEEIKIEASFYLVTVKGRGLDHIVEALDRGTLEILSECPRQMTTQDEDAIWVGAITVEEAVASTD